MQSSEVQRIFVCSLDLIAEYVAIHLMKKKIDRWQGERGEQLLLIETLGTTRS
jgi:hypothetical protein